MSVHGGIGGGITAPEHRLRPAPRQPGCPACGASLAAEQAWCLECGAAARTLIAPTPRHWRLIALVLPLASLLAIAAIAVALARLI